MQSRRVTIIDFATRGPQKRLYSRIMNANYASIMPQVLGVWCEELGHKVRYVCYTGTEDITGALVEDTDILILGAFTRSAIAAYAVSAIYRQKGVVTVLGGPHARCYPEDAVKYFDYVLGFTDKTLIDDLLRDCAPQRPQGRELSASRQPDSLPGVRERWKFIAPTIAKAPALKLIPMIGSMGCPYTCSFCIDSTVAYQPMAFEQVAEDLRFVQTVQKRPYVAWHDPNFGVRFDDYMSTIEGAARPGAVRFVAESSLSLLSEANVKRMGRNGFVGMLPGIESWFDYGNKSRATRAHGADKVRQVSDHVNMILRHIPYVQTNFVLGLDQDEGDAPFELTKQFLDASPGAYPAFSLWTSYGRAAPMNRDLQNNGRVLPFPFHFLNSTRAMNVVPANYSWDRFYDLAIDITRYSYSRKAMARRWRANSGLTAKSLNLVRAASSSRVAYQTRTRAMLDSDPSVRRYFAGESRELPEFYRAQIQRDLGAWWEALPPGGLDHDQNAYANDPGRRSHRSAVGAAAPLAEVAAAPVI
ncbi:MAG: radical SAM protein [Alphaproteobacteria bacterium]|nr:radical SAM protein [Alphaproteobacteria bacterium]